MEIIFSPNAIEDIQYLKKDEQSGHIEKNQTFDKGYSKSPFNGLGKPKPLKMNLRGLGQGELQINID